MNNHWRIENSKWCRTMLIRKNAFKNAKDHGLEFINNDSTRHMISC